MGILGMTQRVTTSTNEELLQSAQRAFETIKKGGDVSGWMDLVRTCRHPQHLWAIDYIEKTDTLIEIEGLIRESEDMLYESKTSLLLKEGYSSDIQQEVCFHTIRAYLRYEDEDFQAAESIWEELLKSFCHQLPIIRQANLFFHCFIYYMFTKKFDKAYECLTRHWLMLKYATTRNRYIDGLWDNVSIMQCVMWFFMDHVEDFVYFFAAQNKMEKSDVIKHKKISFINFMNADISWIVSLATPSLYNHGISIMPDLPGYDGPASSTPRNVPRYEISVDTGSHLKDFYMTKYFEEKARHGIDHEMLASYQESYIHIGRDYSKDTEKTEQLLGFLSRKNPSYQSVLDCGCGNAGGYAYVKFEEKGKDVEGVEISDCIAHKMIKAGRKVKLQSIISFIPYCSHYDLLFSCDLFSHLDIEELAKLEHSWDKFEYLCILIENYPEVYDTGFNNILWTRHNVRSIDDWINTFSAHHEIEYETKDDNILIFGTRRQKRADVPPTEAIETT